MAKRFPNSKIWTKREIKKLNKQLSKLLCHFHVEFGGSWRRKSKALNDIDLIIKTTRSYERWLVRKILVDAGYGTIPSGRNYMDVFYTDVGGYRIPIDIFYCDERNYGSVKLFTTGSRYHNDFLREILASRDMHWDNIRCFTCKKTGLRISFKTEDEALKFLGLSINKPCKRNRGDIMYDVDYNPIREL
jgi:DNA polymerase/3'-5' exonuclease PolX